MLAADIASRQPTVAEQLDRAGWPHGPIHGLYALAALDNEGPLADLDIDDWHDGVQRAGEAARRRRPRAIYDRLETAGMFLVSATRNGGAHGYDEVGARSAMAGAVSGFTKALAKERPAALVKVIDVEVDADAGRRGERARGRDAPRRRRRRDRSHRVRFGSPSACRNGRPPPPTLPVPSDPTR